MTTISDKKTSHDYAQFVQRCAKADGVDFDIADVRRNPMHLTDDEFLNDWPVKSSSGQTMRERCVLRAFLTPEMKGWLDTRPRKMLTFDLVRQFVKKFSLDAREAGKILSQWVKTL